MTATISKGTLNLRFMQKVQREDPELEASSSEPVIKDESQWEVSREVKEMWGITSEPSSSRYAVTPILKYGLPLYTHDYSSSLVTHETSYLPFVLSCNDASGSSAQPAKLRGRRTWNKRGQEVTEVEVRAHI
jgi:hypothetical protein